MIDFHHCGRKSQKNEKKIRNNYECRTSLDRSFSFRKKVNDKTSTILASLELAVQNVWSCYKWHFDMERRHKKYVTCNKISKSICIISRVNKGVLKSVSYLFSCSISLFRIYCEYCILHGLLIQVKRLRNYWYLREKHYVL